MKKLISLLLALVMLISLAVPAFAASELKTDPETGETYEEFTFDFGEFGFDATIEGKRFNIEANFHYETGVYGGKNGTATRIYTKEGNDDIIARVEARVSFYPSAYDEIGVKPGNKREATIGRYEMAHIDSINSKEFAFDGGTDFVGFDLIRVYFGCDHVWGENGKCEYCGLLKCKATGEHIWNENGICEACGALKCDVTGEHIWNENGICRACGALKCEVTGKHDAVKYMVEKCAYCGEKLSEEVIPSQNAASSTFSEGNMTIVCTIAALAIGIGGGYFLGKKKERK